MSVSRYSVRKESNKKIMFIEDHKRISRLKLTINILEDIIFRYNHLYDNKTFKRLRKRLKFYKRELQIRKALTEN